jgi:N-acetylmuramoyl-L-alanine amidase
VAALLCFLALDVAAKNSWQSLERVSVSGSDYVRLSEWAEANDFQIKWPKNSMVVTLTNSASRLQLTIDSRRAEIDGVMVWLTLPVVNRSGAAMISLTDLRSTLHPILFPRPTDFALQTICLDAGHGGKDKGEINGSHFEKKYALLLAEDVEELLKAEGFNVILTRSTDTLVDLPDRPLLARQRGADLFVSLHFNSASGPVRGVEVYCVTPPGFSSSNEGGGRSDDGPFVGNEQNDRNVLLAYEMQKSLVRALPMEDRGMKRSRFEVLREARMPAILVEGGFMSNPNDAAKIYDAAFRKKMARAVADGILAYKRTVEKPLAKK